MKSIEEKNKVIIKIKDLKAEIPKEWLNTNVFAVDFKGCYMVQFTKDNKKWIATNAINGYGDNCRNEFKNEKVTIIHNPNTKP